MTLEEIANELGVSTQRAKQILDSAVKKARKNKHAEEIAQDVFNQLSQQEALEDQIVYLDYSDEEDLTGFWKEENNY